MLLYKMSALSPPNHCNGAGQKEKPPISQQLSLAHYFGVGGATAQRFCAIYIL